MGQTLAFSTVKTYLSGVRFLHLSLGFDNPFAKFPRTKLALKGLKREAAPTRKHLPVTLQIDTLFAYKEKDEEMDCKSEVR